MENISDLQAGKAGEYLACADIILKGHCAFLADKGSCFDIVMEYGKKLFKIQVKSTRGLTGVSNSKYATPSLLFNVGINGKMNKHRYYPEGQVDIFALVDLNLKRIAYIPHREALRRMRFRVPELRGQYSDEKGDVIFRDIQRLRSEGKKTAEIMKITGFSEAKVHNYINPVRATRKGTRDGVYFDQFDFDKCMSKFVI